MANPDKFKSLIGNIFRFTAGERPTADKFNAMIGYFKRNIDELQSAIGDIRDENSEMADKINTADSLIFQTEK